MEIMLKMQWNPGKQKLTDGIFRGFWIRKCAHFHPVGQSPGEMRSKQRGREGGSRSRANQKYRVNERVRRERQRGGTGT